jgi:hypothetical protein
MRNYIYAIVSLICSMGLPALAQGHVPKDVSGVRGFNLSPAKTWVSFGFNMTLWLRSGTWVMPSGSS